MLMNTVTYVFMEYFVYVFFLIPFFIFQELFRTQFLPEYLTLLLNTLVLKSHALRADEIATAIFNMASVDFETFYLFFLPHFLDHTTGLDSNQRMVLRRNMKADQVSCKFKYFIFL